jgi:class 3 adenylate cyclase
MSIRVTWQSNCRRHYVRRWGQELRVLPEFRALFPWEKLLPGESLEVARCAFVFTDLAGSTALYAAQGDPRAFHLIRLHFDVLATAADQNGGTVVKRLATQSSPFSKRRPRRSLPPWQCTPRSRL